MNNMAYAQEMKNLAAEIKTSHQDRTQYIADVKDATHELIAKFQGELKEMARDLKDFLAKSEDTRKKDFDGMMKGIQVKIKEIQGDVKDFLAESEEKRMADFKVTMKDITDRVDDIKKTARGMLGNYKTERKEAAGYWGRLKGKEAAVVKEAVVEEAVAEEAEEEAPKRKKGRRKK